MHGRQRRGATGATHRSGALERAAQLLRTPAGSPRSRTGTSWDTSTTDRVSLRRGERYVRARALAVLRDDRLIACGMVLPLGRWSES